MEATQHTENTRPASTAEPVYLENTLLRVFGVLFCHDAKRARQRSGTIAIDRGVKEKNIAVRIDPEYAQPGPFAHKVAMAVIRKQSSYGRPAQKEISFSQRELVRLSGRKSWGGRQSEQLLLALKQIRYAHVLAHFRVADRYVEHDFSIFNEVMLERRSSPTDPIVAFTIVLADPIIQSLNDRHFTCLNHALMQQLGTIGQALYVRLFFHFATAFDGQRRGRVQFRKRYEDICAEWLGGLTVLAHRSKIMGEQLGKHLDQLVALGFLGSHALTPAESGEGFVLTFRPGPAFFADYQRFYANRFQGEVQFKFHDERQSIGEPHQVAHLFAEKRNGRKPEGIPYVSTKDVETAKELLAQIPMGEISEFLDYALAAAKKTNYPVQTLGGIRRYLDEYLHSRERRAAARAVAAASQAQEEEAQARTDYDRFRRGRLGELFNALPAEEQTLIDTMARAIELPKGSKDGFLARTFIEIERTRIMAGRYGECIPSFEQWCASHVA
jgi:Replication initiator protein A